jgi:DNA phosphorothioation-dependent restriction protein DptG
MNNQKPLWTAVIWLFVINMVIYATNNIDPETGQQPMTYRLNYENATEKRQAFQEKGYQSIPKEDGQIKHPEHLQQHNHLQVLQREALKGNYDTVKEMINELPEHQRKDMTEMIKRTVSDMGRTYE